MAKLSIVAGATSQSVNIFVQNSSVSTGAGLPGLVYNSSGLTAYYSFAGANATSTAITLATLAAVNSSWSTGGFKELDSVNMPGIYRLDIPNAALTTGKGRVVTVYLQGATNMAPVALEIELTGWDNQDGIHGGLSALPNTPCTTNASLITSGSGTDQLTVSGGIASSDAKKINAVSTSSVTTVNANIGTTQPTNFTGTGSSALVKSDMQDIAGSAVSTSSAQLGVNVVNYNNHTAVTDANNYPSVNVVDIGGASSVGNAGYVGIDWAHVLNPTAAVGLSSTTISTSQAVASVSGAVGSVTAAVTVGTNNDKTGYRLATEIRNNTAQAGGSTSLTLDSGASSTTDFYKGAWIVLTGGTGAGQARLCTAYNGSTKAATVSPAWATNPDATSLFTIVPAADVLNVDGNVSGSVGNVTGTVSADLQTIKGQSVTCAGSVTVLASVGTATTSTAQSGDGYAILNNGTYGNSALFSAVQNVQNNTFIATSIPQALQTPSSGSATVNIAIVFSDETGTAKNLDSGNPIITLVNDSGTDLSGRLGAFTNPATGKYVVPYTNTSSDATEGLHWDVSGTVNGKLRRMVAYTQIVDTLAVDFTSNDRTNLNNLATWVGNAGVGLTNVGDARMAHLDANVSSRSAPATPQTIDQTTLLATNPSALTVGWALQLIGADEYTVTTGSPWTVNQMVHGTGAPGTGTLLMSRGLYDTTGSAITSTTVVVGAVH